MSSVSAVSAGRRAPRNRWAFTCAVALVGALASPVLAGSAQADPAPTAVAVAGDLDSKFGCAGDWAPDCSQAQMTKRTDGVWSLTATLPAGTYAYKAALNKSWAVNYGLHAAPGGADISLTVASGGAKVTFLYDETTHWITDTVNTPVVTAVGDFQHYLGCSADWAPDCLRSWLEDPDGYGTYTYTTTAIPAGTYQAKVAVGMTADVTYGQDGTPGGANIPFTVAAGGALTTFSYNAISHQLSIYAGPPKPSLAKSRAYWLAPDYIAWNLGANPAAQTYQLASSSNGGLAVGATGLTGGTVIPLVYDPAGLPVALKAKYPHLASLGALRVPQQWVNQASQLLRGQVAVAAMDRNGNVTDATGLQIPGVLDAIYGAAATKANLGPVFDGGTPTLSVWAPTAQSVNLELYDNADAATATIVLMNRHDDSGVWSITGTPAWRGKFYKYQIKVWAPSVQQVVVNSVVDPYSVAVATDAKLSEIVDLADPSLAPADWGHERSPEAVPAAHEAIQELHIRDFSVEDTTLAADRRGTYLAFTDPNSAGTKHLAELAKAGVTTVHLLPAFEFASVPEDKSKQTTPNCNLASFAPNSDQQQACIAAQASTDAYNWGYDPLLYNTPEGAYTTNPNGAVRTEQFREMVAALHRLGLRVVMDVVYNHTTASGQDNHSVLDRIVPGYYHRLSDTGAVTTDSCCADTAPENAMMNKLVVDSTRLWATQYHVDGFRFDLMGLDPKQTMLDVQASLNATGRSEFLYGEGWNFGVVANDRRFVQASQANMAGTGIGTFNDRLRDAVRGGSVFDTNPHIQGYASGLYTDPNGDSVNGATAQQKATLLHEMDQIKVSLTGNLAGYSFVDSAGNQVTGAQIDYNGNPAGYTAQPSEAINYADAHDNLILYDLLAYKLPTGTSMADRVRMQAMAMAMAPLSQSPSFSVAGSDLLRSKSLDGNSYDSGDWFNAIHWDCTQGNGFGRGLPMAASNSAFWPWAKPLLADPSLVPNCEAQKTASALYEEFLRIKRSTPLLSLGTASEIQQRLGFPLSGTPGEVPGVITMHLDGSGLQGGHNSITVIFNATPTSQTQALASLVGTVEHLHPVQASGADPIVKTSVFDAATGTFTVPARTVAIFVQQR